MVFWSTPRCTGRRHGGITVPNLDATGARRTNFRSRATTRPSGPLQFHGAATSICSRREIIAAVVARMRVMYERKLPLLPGAVDVVQGLAPRFPLAVASSSPTMLIEYVMSEAGIRSLFKVIVSADEVGRGKPAPDVFLVAAERLGYSPDACAVFEDSSAGILAARAAGMFVIAVPNPHYPPHTDALNGADLVLDSLLDFRSESFVRAHANGS